jgi:hypothetical protein
MFDFSTNAKQKDAWLFLGTLWEGLEYLSQQVEQLETTRAESLGQTPVAAKNVWICDFGSSPGDSMICNYFVWYANALHNFILVFQEAFLLSENLEREFGEVLRWRHEVAAHALWALRKRTSRRKRSAKRTARNSDDVAKQEMSIFLYPVFNFGHFEVGDLPRFFRPDDSKQIGESSFATSKLKSGSEWQWGLVPTHERLKEIVSKYASAK